MYVYTKDKYSHIDTVNTKENMYIKGHMDTLALFLLFTLYMLYVSGLLMEFLRTAKLHCQMAQFV